MATSYANAGGTGNRTASITVTTDIALGGTGPINKLVNGDTGESTFWFNSGQGFPRFIKFDFGSPKIIDAFKWYQDTTQDQGTFKWQSSPDDVTYTDRGGSFFLFGTSTGNEIVEPAGNTVAAQYWQLLSIAGQTNGAPWQREIEFRIDDAIAPSGTLAVTEAADVVSIAANLPASGTLSFTDAPDVVSFTSSPAITGTLDYTEARDVVSFTESHHTAALAAIEAPDTVELVGKAVRHPYPVVVILNN